MSDEAEQLTIPVVDADDIALVNSAPDSPFFSGCTGERSEKVKRLRGQILELTAVGVGVRKVASALGISPQLVRAVRSSAWERGELDPLKQRLGRQYLAAADLLRAEALDRIEEIPAHVLLLASAQAADKGQLLTGGATARIERAAQAPADLQELIDALPCEVSPVGAEGAPANKGPLAIEAGSTSASAEMVAGDTLSHALPSSKSACVSPCVSLEVIP